MISKERVIAAIEHKTTDRFPIDVWVDKAVWPKLIDYFGKPADEILQLFGCDIRCVNPQPIRVIATEPDENGLYRDEFGVGFRRIQTATGFHDDCIDHPLEKAETVKEVDDYPWPDPNNFCYETIVGMCEASVEFALIGGYAHFFTPGADLRSYEQWFIDIYEESDVAHAIMEHMLEYWLAYSTKIVELAGDRMDILNIADDYSSQIGLLFSPEKFRSFIQPYLKKIIDLGKKNGKKVFLHSCGAVRRLIPDLIDLGIDVLNPIQIRAAGMDPKELAEEYGRDICFHGGVDLQRTLCRGTVQDVRDEVNYLMDVLGKYNGYIVAPGHTIVSDAPVENIIALFDTAQGGKI